MILIWLMLSFTGNILNFDLPSFGEEEKNRTEFAEEPPSSLNSTTQLPDIFVCPKWSCGYIPNHAPLCQCDKQCILFGDCCENAFWDFLEPNEIINVLANPVNWFEKNDPKANMDVLLLLLKYGKCIDYGSSIYRVVGECPSNYDNQTTRINCKNQDLDLLQNVPVTSRKVPVLSFNNKFCAYCHGFTSEQLIYWNISATCPLSLSVEGMTLTEKLAVFESNCTVKYEPPKRKSKIRKCLSGSYQKCSKDDSKKISLLCNAYYRPYDSYANRDCAICNNETSTQTKCEDERVYETSDNLQNGLTMTDMFRIDLNSDRPEDIKLDELLYICGSSKAKDQKKEKCNYRFCPVGFSKIGFKCEGATNKLNIGGLIPFEKDGRLRKETILFIDIKAVKSEFIDVSNVLSYLEEFVHLFIDDTEVKGKANVNVEHGQNGVYEIEIKTDDVLSVSELLGWIQKMKMIIANDMLKRGLALKTLTISNTRDLEELSCGEFNKATLRDVPLYQTQNQEFRCLVEQNKTVVLSKTRYSVSVTLMDDGFHGDWVVYCYAYINCSLLILDKTEYTLNGSRLYVNGLNEEIQSNQYIKMEEYIFICEEALKLEHVTESRFTNAINILTKATLSISVFCLIIFLILHMKYQKFRNLHGKSMMSFALALIIAHFSVIMDTDRSSSTCVAIAILRHYVWLCVFLWCGVIAFDLAGRFCTRTMMSFGRANEDRRFKKYCLVAWVTPLVIVTTCICVHFLADGNQVGYGSNDLCWIGNPYALLASFFIPVLLIMLINIVCLIVTVTGIETTKRATKNVTKYKKDKTRVFIYIKVSFLLGTTWIFVFLASSFNEPVLEILQTLLNGLQGVFLLFAFLSNKRTMNIICKRTSTSSTRKEKTFSTISTVSHTVSTSQEN